MKHCNIYFEWFEAPVGRFRTGVSLHSHTHHSRETFGIIHKIINRHIPTRWLVAEGEMQCRIEKGLRLDPARVWWTPPCPPYDAWLLEKNQIEQRLRMRALISLTDHDNIEAPLSLRVLRECRDIPVSVEWSVPHGPAQFHLGIHNLAAETARQSFRDLAHYTATSQSPDLYPILETLAANPQILIVLNHPCWDESGLGFEKHVKCVAAFLRNYGSKIHALELNGLRPWKENRQVLQLARTFEKPIISGGDRHAFEPNAILDLSDAATFSEYVEQVRSGWTDVLVTKQYREPFSLRTLQCLSEMLRDYPCYGQTLGRWTDRVFYRCDDGVVRPLTELFANGLPTGMKLLATAISLICHRNLRRTVRVLVPPRREFAL